ncbi:MAG: SpaA isopeptide-forming pilin-related protein [Oscillospiraceae bacterium]
MRLRKILSSFMAVAVLFTTVTASVNAQETRALADYPYVSPSDGNPFGSAVDYNLLTLGNSQDVVKVEGASAIGGDCICDDEFFFTGVVQGVVIPSYLECFITKDNTMPKLDVGLLMGGGFQLHDVKSIRVHNGDVISPKKIPFMVNGGNYVAKSTTNFFAEAKKTLTQANKTIFDLAKTGIKPTVNKNKIEFIGKDPSVNVFTIDFNEITPSRFYQSTIEVKIPTSSYALINVVPEKGKTAVTIGNQSFSCAVKDLKDLTSRIIYNFSPEITKIEYMTQKAMHGMFLAPNADFYVPKDSGDGLLRTGLNGNLWVKSVKSDAKYDFNLHYWPLKLGLTIPFAPITLSFTKQGQIDSQPLAPLAGAVFSLTKTGEPPVTLTSDTNGLVSLPILSSGNYTLAEVSAPENYVKSNQSYVFTVLEDGTTSFDATHVEPIFVNAYQAPTPIFPVTVHFTKMGCYDNIELPLYGAIFSLSKTNGDTVNIVSDLSGAVSLALPSAGDYTITEVSAPVNYIKSDASYTFTANQDGTTTFSSLDAKNLFLNFYQPPTPTFPVTVSFRKFDQNRSPLPNAVFSLSKNLILASSASVTPPTHPEETISAPESVSLNESASPSESVTLTTIIPPPPPPLPAPPVLTNSQADGLVSFSISEPGSYTIRELSAPENYVASTYNFEFSVNENGTVSFSNEELIVAETAFINTREAEVSTDTTFIKYDNSNNPLPSAIFALSINGVVADRQFISNQDGIVSFGLLDDGEYVITELSAPTGYTKSTNSYTFSIANNESSFNPSAASELFINNKIVTPPTPNPDPPTVTETPIAKPQPYLEVTKISDPPPITMPAQTGDSTMPVAVPASLLLFGIALMILTRKLTKKAK